MQVFPGPRFLTQAPRGLSAQLPQTSPRPIRPILMGGQSRQVVPDQGVDGGVTFSGMTANGSQNVLVDAERDVLHLHSIRVTVLPVRSAAANIES